MNKKLSAILVFAIILSMLLSFSGCFGDLSDLSANQPNPDATVSNSAFPEQLTLEKVGTVDETDFYAADGGLYYKDENGKYGVMSLRGDKDTGAIYTRCAPQNIFFAVSTKSQPDFNNIDSINTLGLINGNGETLLSDTYAAFSVLNERYIRVYKATERTYSSDSALFGYSSSSMTPTLFPGDDDALYKGTWTIYDVKNGVFLSGATGTTDTTAGAYGNFVYYYDDSDTRHTMHGDGLSVPENATIFTDGSYAVEEKSGTVYDTNGNKMFSYDLTGFCPSSYVEDVGYIGSQHTNDGTKYVVMNTSGEIISAEFTSSISVYGKLIQCDNKIYNYEGKNVISGEYSVTYDKIFKNTWFLYKDDVYTMINENGDVLYTDTNDDDVNISPSDFVACKDSNDGSRYYYCHKDKDYTIKDATSFAPWLVKVSGTNYLFNIVDTITGETLLDGYESYTYSKAKNTTVYVYARYNGGTDIYQLLNNEQLLSVEKMKANLLDDLVKAFDDAGIVVTVDTETGVLAMDSSVLFGGDSAVLTDDGKAFLKKFLAAYTSIITSDKYKDFVDMTMIEGHTAPVSGSSFEDGLPLSEERAENVLAFCISPEAGVDTSAIADSFKAVGYSNSQPVYNADGSVNMDASRRVSFRFVVNVDE